MTGEAGSSCQLQGTMHLPVGDHARPLLISEMKTSVLLSLSLCFGGNFLREMLVCFQAIMKSGQVRGCPPPIVFHTQIMSFTYTICLGLG